MKTSHRHKWIPAIVVLLFVFVLLGKSFYQSKYSLTCTSYRIQTNKVQKTVRIIQITDLHNSIFGEENQKLINLAAKQSPDIILLTGDLLNSNESGTDIATDLISDLCNIIMNP